MGPLRVGVFNIVLTGVPLQCERGAVGWSTVALVEDGGDRILVDCGGRGDALALRKALERLGVAPDDIDIIVLSHLHFDHAGGLAFYPEAELVLSLDEVHHAQEANRDPWKDPALASCIADELSRRHVRTVQDGDAVGSLRVVRLPGHTPGSIGVVDSSGAIFAGDAAKNLSEATTGTAGSAIDIESANETIAALRLGGYSAVIPGHDRPFRWAGETVEPIAELELNVMVATRHALIESRPPGLAIVLNEPVPTPPE